MLSEGGGVALTPEDRARLLRLRELLLARGDDIVGRFYDELDSRPTFSRYLPTGEGRVRLRRLQTYYFDELLTGCQGETYRARRVAVGEAHQRVGLPQRLYTESYAIYLDLLSEAAMEVLGSTSPEVAPTLRALGLAVLLDVGLVHQAWSHAQRQSELKLRAGEVAREAHGVAQRLIDSALPVAMETQPINLCALARGLAPLLPGMVPDGIALEVDCEEAERVVLIDPGQLERVLLGLIDNAIEALPEGGRLSLHIGGHRLDDVDARAWELPAGEYHCVVVDDDGVGLSEDAQKHLFEPRFGAGPGSLILPTAWSIVRAAGGRVRVWSLEGEGTRFEILLPGVGEEAVPGPGAVELKGRGQLVLIADGGTLPSCALGRLLIAAGYRVQVRRSCAEAEELLGGADLLITDVTLTDGSGAELARKAVDSKPEIGVLFCGPEGTSLDRAPGGGLSVALSWPAGPRDLLAAVNQVLVGAAERLTG